MTEPNQNQLWRDLEATEYPQTGDRFLFRRFEDCVQPTWQIERASPIQKTAAEYAKPGQDQCFWQRPVPPCNCPALREALEWAMSKEPSPCRCLPCATPAHVCIGHAALAATPCTSDKTDPSEVQEWHWKTKRGTGGKVYEIYQGGRLIDTTGYPFSPGLICDAHNSAVAALQRELEEATK